MNNQQRRDRNKRELLKRRGKQCKECGYAKTISALCFHHRNPDDKEFNLSGTNLTRKSKQKREEEADKCDVYCLNCHMELHDREEHVQENGNRTKKLK
jgi:hypothetical protein